MYNSLKKHVQTYKTLIRLISLHQAAVTIEFISQWCK